MPNEMIYSEKQTKGSIVIIEIAPSNLEDPWNYLFVAAPIRTQTP